VTWFAIDGMDGSGKSTSSSFIRQQLESEGRRVLEITHPNRDTAYGRAAEKYLMVEGKGAALMSTMLYILDVLRSLRYKRRHRNEYDDVIFVRYSLAAAYMPDRLCRPVYKLIEFFLPVPDVKIYVDTEPEKALERIMSRGESIEAFETPEKLERTRRRMKLITDSWITVDNSGPEEDTREQTRSILDDVKGSLQ